MQFNELIFRVDPPLKSKSHWVDTFGLLLEIQQFAFRFLSWFLPLVVLGYPWSPPEYESERNRTCATFGGPGSSLVAFRFNSQFSGTCNQIIRHNLQNLRSNNKKQFP